MAARDKQASGWGKIPPAAAGVQALVSYPGRRYWHPCKGEAGVARVFPENRLHPPGTPGGWGPEEGRRQTHSLRAPCRPGTRL